MTPEQYEILKPLEYSRAFPLFTNAIEGKNYGMISSTERSILNNIGYELVKERWNMCPSCGASRTRMLKRIGQKFFDYERLNKM